MAARKLARLIHRLQFRTPMICQPCGLEFGELTPAHGEHYISGCCGLCSVKPAKLYHVRAYGLERVYRAQRGA
ncbi:MAG: hypothetical protein WCF45_10445 [Photobacterium halotolerans]